MSRSKTPIRKQLNLRPGDHIYVRRTVGFPRMKPYSHHGIYVGNNEVVHFNGEPGKKHLARIEKTSIEEFLGNSYKVDMIEIYPHKPSLLRSREHIVRTALSLLGKGNYSLFAENCEHFAHYCATGIAHSAQIRKLSAVLLVITTIAGGIMLAANVAHTIMEGTKLFAIEAHR